MAVEPPSTSDAATSPISKGRHTAPSTPAMTELVHRRVQEMLASHNVDAARMKRVNAQLRAKLTPVSESTSDGAGVKAITEAGQVIVACGQLGIFVAADLSYVHFKLLSAPMLSMVRVLDRAPSDTPIVSLAGLCVLGILLLSLVCTSCLMMPTSRV